MNYRQAVEAALQGDADAFGALYEKTYGDMYYIAQKYVKNAADAEDVLQDAYVKAFRSLSSLRDPDSFPGWLGRIVANTAKNMLARKNPILFSEIEKENEDGDSYLYDVEDDNIDYQPELNYTRQETQMLVRELIDSLSDEQRMCILMFYLDNQSIRDIAETFSISENTVKSRLNYGRKVLKKKAEDLQKKGYKLYSVAALPLLLYLLRMERNSAEFAQAAQASMRAGLQRNGAALQRNGAALQGTPGNGPQVQGGNLGTGSAVKKAAVKGSLKLTARKVIIAAIATAGIGAGTAAVLHYVNGNMSVPSIQREVAESQEEESAQTEKILRTETVTERTAETVSVIETEAEPETITGTVIETETETEPEPGTEIETETETEKAAETAAETESETQFEPGIKIVIESETPGDTEAPIEIETRPESSAGTETQPQSGSEEDMGIRIVVETEPEATAKTLTDDEYPQLIAGNLTKAELEFVLAYGPREIPEGGFQEQDCGAILNQLCGVSQYLQEIGEAGHVEYYGVDESWESMYSVDDVNRMFASFSDFTFTEENYGRALGKWICVENGKIIFSPATLNYSSTAAITSTEYADGKLYIYYTLSTHYDEKYDSAAGVYVQNVNEDVFKKATLAPDAQGMYKIVKIEDAGQETQAAVPETQAPSQTSLAGVAEAYKGVLQAVANGQEGYVITEAEGSTEPYQYFLYDMEGDGIPELIVGQSCIQSTVLLVKACHVYTCQATENGYVPEKIQGVLWEPLLPAQGSGIYSRIFYRGQGLTCVYRVTIQEGALVQPETTEYEFRLAEPGEETFANNSRQVEWTDITDDSALAAL